MIKRTIAKTALQVWATYPVTLKAYRGNDLGSAYRTFYVDGTVKDYIKISFAGTDSLYVPATQLDMVSKYIGAGEDHPVKLSKMGGADWSRTKSRAKAKAKDLARELTQLYAARAKTEGHAFLPDSPWQTEFEARFGTGVFKANAPFSTFAQRIFSFGNIPAASIRSRSTVREPV